MATDAELAAANDFVAAWIAASTADLDTLVAVVTEVTGTLDAKGLAAWLTLPNRALRDRTPLAALAAGDGAAVLSRARLLNDGPPL